MARMFKDNVVLRDLFGKKAVIEDWKWTSGPAITGFVNGEPITTSRVVAKDELLHGVYIKTKNGRVYELGVKYD